jgi:hypothetical protein
MVQIRISNGVPTTTAEIFHGNFLRPHLSNIWTVHQITPRLLPYPLQFISH